MAVPWGAIASIAGAGLSFLGGKKQNQANQQAAQAQMDFQERMSNSAYQRSMKDMRLAGLNPILAYKQGGATTPSGQSYQAQNVAGTAAKAGIDTYAATTTAQNTRANTALINAQTSLAAAKAADYRKWGTNTFAINTERGLRTGRRVTKAVIKGHRQPKVSQKRAGPLPRNPRNTPASSYRRPRPGEPLGLYFSSPNTQRRQGY